jgi:hypothetical protein
MTDTKHDLAAIPNGPGLSDLLGLSATLQACWTLTETLDAGKTTYAGRLWFTNPKNSAWEPIYRRAALDRALEHSREVLQHNAELVARCERMRIALDFIAEHFSTDWPDRCQSNVLAARRVLGPNVELSGHQRPARKDEDGTD